MLAENAGELARIGQGELPEDVLTLGMERIVGQRIARVPADYRALLDFSAVLGPRPNDVDWLNQADSAEKEKE